MQKTIPLSELQAIKFENVSLKQRLLEKEMQDLQAQQTEVIREVYPEFNGRHKCALNIKEKMLTISDDEAELEKVVNTGVN